jgi:hypothetical protein
VSRGSQAIRGARRAREREEGLTKLVVKSTARRNDHRSGMGISNLVPNHDGALFSHDGKARVMS